MADTVKIDGPVKIQSDSPHRVAFDLMLEISARGKGTKDEAFFLTLYSRCLKVVRGGTATNDNRQQAGSRPDMLT